MAKKGQKFNRYDSTLKYEICKKHFEEGYTEGMIVEEYGLPIGSVRYIFRNYITGKGFNNKKGRPKEDEIDYKARYEILKKYQAFLKELHKRK